MLVLTRRSGQSIQIDSNIRVIVVSVSNGRAKLGFEAPDDVRILRSELEDREAVNVGSHPVATLDQDDVAPLVAR